MNQGYIIHFLNKTSAYISEEEFNPVMAKCRLEIAKIDLENYSGVDKDMLDCIKTNLDIVINIGDQDLQAEAQIHLETLNRLSTKLQPVRKLEYCKAFPDEPRST